MYFLVAGIGLVIWNYYRIGLVPDMSWWWVLSPFAMAIAWWSWSDSTGRTKRKEMEKVDRRKQERIDRQRNAMGIRTKKR